MASQITQIKHRVCFKCGYAGETAETRCAECGKLLQTSTSIRVRGGLMVLCGGFLVAMMGYITYWAVIATNDPTPGRAKFNGTHEQMQMIEGIFGLLIMFGLISFITGMRQLIMGRRNRLFVCIVVGIGILSFIGGGVIIWSFG